MEDELRLSETPKRFWKQDYRKGMEKYPEALARDDYTCYYCGFKAENNWISYIDHDASNTSLDNMRTVSH